MYLTEILAQCSRIEARVASLYRMLAERFGHSQETARFWRELALEEETHADILRRELRSFEEEDDTGSFLPEYEPRLRHADQVLAQLEARTRNLQTIDDALAFSIAIEQAELEDLYDDLVAQGYPAFKLISERLEAALTAKPQTNIPGLPKPRRSPTLKTPPR